MAWRSAAKSQKFEKLTFIKNETELGPFISLFKIWGRNDKTNLDPLQEKIEKLKKKLDKAQPLRPESQVIKPCCYQDG